MNTLSVVALTLLVAAKIAAAQTPAAQTPAAQTPAVENGHARCASADRSRSIASSTPSSPGRPIRCGSATRSRRTRVADDSGCWSSQDGSARPPRPGELEARTRCIVLYRVADRRVDRIQFSSPDCPLDAGGLTMRWLTGVSAAASIDWLARFTAGESTRRLQNQAVVAIALHADPPATRSPAVAGARRARRRACVATRCSGSPSAQVRRRWRPCRTRSTTIRTPR